VGWLLCAVLHAVIILVAVVEGADPTEVDRRSGQTLSLGQNGILMFSIVIITVHTQLGCCIDHWTWMHHASCWGSIGGRAAGGGAGRGWAGRGGGRQARHHQGAASTAGCGPAFGAWGACLAVHPPSRWPRRGLTGPDPPRPCSHLPPALWFVFLLAYGAFPVTLATDLHKMFYGTIANARFFWMTAAATTLVCVLPVFGARQLQRYLRPACYQVVQEIAARERAGEALGSEPGGAGGAALGGKPAEQLASRSTRLMQRKALRSGRAPPLFGGGSGPLAAVLRRRYSGFVPPVYEAHSRVFDSSELRASAAAAGYSISSTGEIIVPLPTRLGTLSGTITQSGGARAATAAGPSLLLQSTGVGGFGLATDGGPDGGGTCPPSTWSPMRPFVTGALARALSGLSATSQGRRTISTGALAVGAAPAPGQRDAAPLDGSAPLSTGADGAPPAFGLGRASMGPSLGGSSATSTLLSTGSKAPACGTPQDQGDSYAGNPVLALLEREFSRDPRRHRHGVKLSLMSISNLPRIRLRSAKAKGSRGGSRPGSFTGLLGGDFSARNGDGLEGGGLDEAGGDSSGREVEPWRMAFSEGGESWLRSGRGSGRGLADAAAAGAAVATPFGSGGPGAEMGPSSALEPPQQLEQPGRPAPLPPPPSQAPPQQQVEPGYLAARLQPQAWSAGPGQTHRAGAPPSRLLRMAAPADPSPTAQQVAAPADLCPSPLPGAVGGAAAGVGKGAAAGGAGAAAGGAAAPAELQREDPAMYALYVAALKGCPPGA
jgi:hypothetical protein